MTAALFADRAEAGHRLGARMAATGEFAAPTLVLGLVRGGAVVAQAVAKELSLDWDILIVRKLGAPMQPEYAVGALAETGALVLNHEAVSYFGLSQDWLATARNRAMQECQALHEQLRGSAERPLPTARDVVLVDDGIATGFSMFAALEAMLSVQAHSVAVAVPVLAKEALRQLTKRQDATCHYLSCPEHFHAVGQFYRDFRAVSSDEVRRLLEQRPA